jgi:glutathione synthase/RimK-type ligase-like ATP-grasp enzyme
MHREFEKHNVPCPETLVITDLEDLKKISVEFPILTKIPNGNHSRGIISHSNIKELSNYVAARRVTDEVLLLQEQMSVDFDIRVVTIGKEVVYHYWRDKQLSKEFTTTSTSNGSILRVDDLPKEIIKCVQTVSSELGLRMAAYDITYFVDNDKLTPKIFEVSPSFLLNPIPKDTATLSLPYINYKKGWRRFVIDRIEQFVILKKLYVKEVQSSRLTGMDR